MERVLKVEWSGIEGLKHQSSNVEDCYGLRYDSGGGGSEAMNNQNRFRPSLVPLQQSQLDQFMMAGRSNKRLRGAVKTQGKIDNDCFVVEDKQQNATSSFRSQHPDPYRFTCRQGGSPLPPLKWAKSEEVWNLMCWKENVYRRDPNLLQRHPQITPKMRAVLFEWISEVCEVYKLHRETFYLAVDFIDRYLSAEQYIPKAQLQLVGITALFIAAKLEEIYPPQLKEFAYVTDQACTADEILSLEICMLKTLKWALSPVTVNHWLMVYLQVIANEVNSNLVNNGIFEWRRQDFLVPQFQRLHYIRLTQLTDLCALDPGALRFPYSILAASAFYHILQPEHLTLLVSGYAWHDLQACISWMTPFATVIKEQEVSVKIFPEIPQDDMHNIQSHFIHMPLLERAQALALEYTQNSTPPPNAFTANRAFDIFPTPPRSDERQPMHLSRLNPIPIEFLPGKPSL